jgi:hypothetical protein
MQKLWDRSQESGVVGKWSCRLRVVIAATSGIYGSVSVRRTADRTAA